MHGQVTDHSGIEARSGSRSGDRPTPPSSRGGGRRSQTELTRPGIRARSGRICPRCRDLVEGDSTVPPGPVARCPHDGSALVPVPELLEADGDPFLGATIADRFVIIGRLGAGLMGTVYRARQEAMSRDVAVKILRGDRAAFNLAKARFAREARAMSLLASPHTVTVFDFGEIPDPSGDELRGDASLYLAMELLEGESLGTRLKRRGRLPVDEAVRVARHALLSLAEAHDKGIIDRDLKPDNLFLARMPAPEQGEICKVLDFGIAKVKSEPSNVDALETQAGTVFGTPRYMSPEQAQGKPLDARSDLYTLGVLLYQMLVGRAPFVDDDAVVVMARHIKSMPIAPAEAAPEAGIGTALSALIMRALAKDPDERPQTAQQFLAELDRAMIERAAARGEISGGVAAASGELAAMVHDGLDAGPARLARARGRMPRSRALTIAFLSAVVVFLLSLAAVGALRPARDAVPVMRAEIGHLVTARRLALLQAEAAASAKATAAPAPPADPPAASAPPSALPVAPAAPVKKSPRRYKRFE
ncbi:MAG: serine/threonine-protein kinase [Minicystis sp.]